MNNVMIFKSVSLGVIISLSSIASMPADDKPVVLRGEPTVKHYVVHALGDFVGAITATTVAGASVAVGAAIAAGSRSPEVAVPAAAMSVAGCVAAFYIYYKTPEWTDTYFLERGNGRTTGQNIATLLTRTMFPLWPLGVIAGEYLVYEDDANGKN